jgi:hypothetical protein
MEDVHLTYFIVIPIGLFLAGFIIGRQFRVFETVPIFSSLFVKHRFLFSTIMGGLIILIFAFILFLTEFSFQQVFILFALFLLATLSYYYGTTLGWGRSKPITDGVASAIRSHVNTFPENIIVENQPSSIKITVNTKKRWGWFAMSLFPLPIMLCLFPFLSMALIGLAQKYMPEGLDVLAGILIVGLMLYSIYKQFRETLEFITDKEIIEIDIMSVRIEKYGLGFKSIKEYPADNIKRINAVFSFAGSNIPMTRSPFINQNMPAFMMWHNHGLKRFSAFGRGIDLADAERILRSIYGKFPQYQG